MICIKYSGYNENRYTAQLARLASSSQSYRNKKMKRGLKGFGAGNEIRTRDPDLGKVVLYQLSYSRFFGRRSVSQFREGHPT